MNKISEIVCEVGCDVLPQYYTGELTLQELLYKVIDKVNEIVDSQNNLVEEWKTVRQWIMDNIESITINQLNEWLQDGTFENIINEVIFGKLDERVTKNTNDIADIDRRVNTNTSNLSALSNKQQTDHNDLQGQIDHNLNRLIPTAYSTEYKARLDRFPDLSYSWTLSAVTPIGSSDIFLVGFVNTENPNVACVCKYRFDGSKLIFQTELQRFSDYHLNDSTAVDSNVYVFATGRTTMLCYNNASNTFKISPAINSYTVNAIENVNGVLYSTDGTNLTRFKYDFASNKVTDVSQHHIYRPVQVNQGMHYHEDLNLLMCCRSNATSISLMTLDGECVSNAPVTNCQSELETLFKYNGSLYGVFNTGRAVNNNNNNSFITKVRMNCEAVRGGYNNMNNPIVPFITRLHGLVPKTSESLKVSFRDGIMYIPSSSYPSVKSFLMCFSHIMVRFSARVSPSSKFNTFCVLVAVDDMVNTEDTDIFFHTTFVTPEGYMRTYSIRCNPPTSKDQASVYFNFTRSTCKEINTNLNKGEQYWYDKPEHEIYIEDVYGINQTYTFIPNMIL